MKNKHTQKASELYDLMEEEMEIMVKESKEDKSLEEVT